MPCDSSMEGIWLTDGSTLYRNCWRIKINRSGLYRGYLSAAFGVSAGVSKTG